jgi:hypothetical protein
MVCLKANCIVAMRVLLAVSAPTPNIRETLLHNTVEWDGSVLLADAMQRALKVNLVIRTISSSIS